VQVLAAFQLAGHMVVLLLAGRAGTHPRVPEHRIEVCGSRTVRQSAATEVVEESGGIDLSEAVEIFEAIEVFEELGIPLPSVFRMGGAPEAAFWRLLVLQ
jgi:NaMN:DMB phosphoribosyltransferase